MEPITEAPEGGLPCYKQVIDQRNALVQQMACMEATMTLSLYAEGWTPSEKQRDDFKAAADALALVAADIVKSAPVGGGG